MFWQEVFWKFGRYFGNPGGVLEIKEVLWQLRRYSDNPGGTLAIQEVFWKFDRQYIVRIFNILIILKIVQTWKNNQL